MTTEQKQLWLVLAIAGLSQMIVFALLFSASVVPSRAQVIDDLDHCTANLNRIYEMYYKHPGKPI